MNKSLYHEGYNNAIQDIIEIIDEYLLSALDDSDSDIVNQLRDRIIDEYLEAADE